MKRILAIWLPNWPIQRLICTKSELNGQPVVLHHGTRRGQCVVACSREAWELGVRKDMPIAEATVLAQRSGTWECGDKSPHSQGAYLDAYDPVGDRLALEKLAAWCHRFSPSAGLADDEGKKGTLLLDVTGIAPLFGGEPSLTEQVERSLQRFGLTVQIGLADTIGAAWALAHYGGRGKGDRNLLCAAPEGPFRQKVPVPLSATTLSNLPVAALRLPDDTVTTLDRLGLRRIGDLLSLPGAELKSRFGPLLLKRLDQMFGRAAEMIRCIHPQLDFTAEWLFECPVDQPEVIHHAIRQLVKRVCFLLQDRGQGALRLTCRLRSENEKRGRDSFAGTALRVLCTKESRPLFSFSVGLFRPSAEAAHLMSLVEMQRREFPGSVTSISVRVDNHAPLTRRQQKLFDEQQRRHDAPQVSALIDRLAGRLGRQAVVRCTLQSDAQPEMACREEPLVDGLTQRGRESFFRAGGNRQRSANAHRAARKNPPRPLAPLDRPLHLLVEPAPLQVHAVVPDGPPIRFQFRGQRHDVTHCWGPERIETGWWRRRGVRRDYYRVETKEGRRFWLFRHMQDGRWFLHGIF